ncbi:hypothetical protein ACIRD3_26715 [Kitasatospora sp. NPDC093550]|uniref:hypothetical protein n=1 Tax=Kitasatospora sp. NPDC093550 TaxID=3364089 RepID=UPI0037FB2EC6
MRKDQIGRLIGGSFGFVFVQANAGALPTPAAIPLRVLAILAFLRIVFAGRRAAVPAPAGDSDATASGGVGFGRGYWYVVAAEAVGLLAGLMLINKVLHTGTVAWITFVVGVHFFGLAVVWKRPDLHVLAGTMAACGVGGLVLAACGASAAVIAVVAGVAPGALLLGSVLWAGRAAVKGQPVDPGGAG